MGYTMKFSLRNFNGSIFGAMDIEFLQALIDLVTYKERKEEEGVGTALHAFRNTGRKQLELIANHRKDYHDRETTETARSLAPFRREHNDGDPEHSDADS